MRDSGRKTLCIALARYRGKLLIKSAGGVKLGLFQRKTLRRFNALADFARARAPAKTAVRFFSSGAGDATKIAEKFGDAGKWREGAGWGGGGGDYRGPPVATR